MKQEIEKLEKLLVLYAALGKYSSDECRAARQKLIQIKSL